MASEVISCPVCGAAMNHHANKIMYGSEEAAAGVSEVLEEFHECPHCGASVTRPGALIGHT